VTLTWEAKLLYEVHCSFVWRQRAMEWSDLTVFLAIAREGASVVPHAASTKPSQQWHAACRALSDHTLF
jgi:hypothetical protein